MQVIVLKDGTIPVAVAKVIGQDGDPFKYGQDVLSSSEAHEYVEVFEVPDGTQFIGVTWDEFMGFQVFGFHAIDSALGWLNEEATPEQVANSNLDGKHWAVTYNEGDDESYGHVFAVHNITS